MLNTLAYGRKLAARRGMVILVERDGFRLIGHRREWRGLSGCDLWSILVG